MLFHPAWKDLLINTTFWTVLLIAGILVWRRFLTERAAADIASAMHAVRRFLHSRVLLALLLCGTSLSGGFGLYLGYQAPRDIMQDIIGARLLWEGETPYMADIGPLMKSSVEAETPLFRLGDWWPAMVKREGMRDVVARPAHTPVMMVAFMPFVRVFSIRGTYLAHMVLSMAALFWMMYLLSRGLGWRPSRRLAAVLVLAVLGWHPVVSSVRFGQSIGVLGALITFSWFCLRTGRPNWAGIAIGIAACLKIYPGLLIPYFLFFHRRAFGAALVTCVGVLAVPVLLFDWQLYADWLHAGQVMFEASGDVSYNLSLVGLSLREIQALGLTAPGNAVLAVVMMLGALGTMFCLAPRRPTSAAEDTRRLDLEYSLIVVLMILLSPTTWDHYLPILLLPIAVLGKHVLATQPSWAGLLTFFGLLTALSIPSWTYMWFFSSWPAVVGLPLSCGPTLATLALCLWIGALRRLT